ncbi:MAG: metallophosphoesterase [Gemmataceae bacterium]|nr:metallophosphoesterase [Gemmata sp.]MDW8196089.1 metallophosphoesterase [Gemmataceae bacterium]
MKHFLLGIVTATALAAAVGLSRVEFLDARAPATTQQLMIETADKNPWTSLQLNNDPDQFTFAVVSDRTGGHRPKVFSQAVYRLNLLQPQFVMSVGDLIEGYTTKEDTIKEEWDEFDSYVKKFEMPFFYVPGNHDLTNKIMVAKWGERYGKRYYHFTYKGVLFLCLCSENPPNMGTIDKEQQEWIDKTLQANKDVRWTFLFLHKPIWTAKDLEANGWATVEKSLAGRNYTVFCGHVHRYVKYERNGMEYFQLATTGGGSRLRGTDYGEFDHVAWVTMKKNKPLIANIMLDGVLPNDLKVPDSDEKGVPRKLRPTFPVSGRLTIGGQPIAGLTIVLNEYNAQTERYVAVAEGRTDDKGRFEMTTYAKFDGAPAGEYVATVVKAEGVPEIYTAPTTSTLKVRIHEMPNMLNFDLPVR